MCILDFVKYMCNFCRFVSLCKINVLKKVTVFQYSVVQVSPVPNNIWIKTLDTLYSDLWHKSLAACTLWFYIDEILFHLI